MRNWTPTTFLQTSGMFWECFTLHAALELDIFSPLAEGPLPVAELAQKTGCSPRGLNMMVTALCALELLQRTGEGVTLMPFARQYLCRDRKEYLGYMVGHHRRLAPRWLQLADTVRAGHSLLREQDEAPTDHHESFLMGMRNVANAQASRSVPHIDIGQRRRLLDLGGATGAYAVRFCREHPDMTATVFDLPTSRPYAQRVLAEEGMEDRIDFVAGDFTRDELPGGYDVAWLSQILHSHSPDMAARVVRKAGQALVNGGLLLIQEFTLDDDRTGPQHPALFSLNMLLQTAEGQAYTQSELMTFMHDAGARDIRVLPLDLPQGCRILAGVITR